MELVINGQARDMTAIHEGSTIADLVEALALQPGRVALERNGEIVARDQWQATSVTAGDRMEIVHFVGGGAAGR